MPILIPAPGTTPPAPPPPTDAAALASRGVLYVPDRGPGLRLFWEPDGLVDPGTGQPAAFDIGSPASPIRLGSGVRGFGLPPLEHYEDSAAAVDGSRWRGHRVPKRPVTWPLRVRVPLPASQEWLDYDALFWSTLTPARTGGWRVVSPDGRSRTLRLRVVDDSDHAFLTDPALTGHAAYLVHLQAEWPYWQGEPVVREFRPPADVGFFAGPGVINISPGGSFATAAITNPGDVDAYLTYYAAGPITAATVRGTQLPAVAAGKGVILDTSPASGQVAWDADVATVTGPDGQPAKVFTVTGVDRTSELGAVDFSPVPPGGEVPVPMTVTGTGTIRVELVPDYYRAW